MRYLVRFDDDAALDPERVGPKFAGLARAARAGFPVPPAVAVIPGISEATLAPMFRNTAESDSNNPTVTCTAR